MSDSADYREEEGQWFYCALPPENHQILHFLRNNASVSLQGRSQHRLVGVFFRLNAFCGFLSELIFETQSVGAKGGIWHVHNFHFFGSWRDSIRALLFKQTVPEDRLLTTPTAYRVPWLSTKTIIVSDRSLYPISEVGLTLKIFLNPLIQVRDSIHSPVRVAFTRRDCYRR
jgi:hypothetical protein